MRLGELDFYVFVIIITTITMFPKSTYSFSRLSAFPSTPSSGPSLYVKGDQLLPVLEIVAAHGIGTYSVRRFLTAHLIELIGIEEDIATRVRDAVTRQVDNVSVVLLADGIVSDQGNDASVEGGSGIVPLSPCEPESIGVQTTLF
jgi:hypothetical protein